MRLRHASMMPQSELLKRETVGRVLPIGRLASFQALLEPAS